MKIVGSICLKLKNVRIITKILINQKEKWMSNFICTHCGMTNIDCGKDGFKTPRELELEEAIKTIFTSLIIANHVDIGAIQDTIWVDTFTTLWDYIRIVLNMDDEQFEEFEKQAIKKRRVTNGNN